MALMGDPVRRETATALVALETIEVKRPEFLALVELGGSHFEQLQRDTSRRVTDNAVMEMRPETGAIMDFLMDEGLGEATNVLVIDEALCIGCDNCEKACAETHAGVSRLDREAGHSFAQIHVPIACRHCEQPHCMKDCPPNAIHRSSSGEVFIDDTLHRLRQLPGQLSVRRHQDGIRATTETWSVRSGCSSDVDRGPARARTMTPTRCSQGERGKKAVKCDACVEVANGPACVKACPTGAALRIGPERFIDLVADRRS